jgi:hypothetical protein
LYSVFGSGKQSVVQTVVTPQVVTPVQTPVEQVTPQIQGQRVVIENMVINENPVIVNTQGENVDIQNK